MKSKKIKLLLKKVFLILISSLLISTPTINLQAINSKGMKVIQLSNEVANFYSYGKAETSTWYQKVDIATSEGPGITWYSTRLIFQPRFEIGIRVTIDDSACKDSSSYAFDGFALVLSDKIQNVGGLGDSKGYGGLFNLLVSEFDFFGNQGDISSDTFSMHRCYNTYCESKEDSTTSQVNLPFYYDKCKSYIYDVKFVYVDSNIKIYLNDSLIYQGNENLLDKFNGYGYFGVSGYFRGNQRNLGLDLNKSYYTQDIISKIDYYSVVENIKYTNSLPNNIPAGSKIEVTCRFSDIEGYIIPHLKEQSQIAWTFTIKYNCKTPEYKSDFFIYSDKINIRNYVNIKKSKINKKIYFL